MQDIVLKDNSFNMTGCADSDLYIQVGTDGFSFLVRDPVSKAIRQFHLYPFNSSGSHLIIRKIRDILAENEILQQSFSKTTLLFTDRRFTLIPEILYSDKLTDFLLQVKQKQGEESETIVVPIQQIKAFLAFSVSKDLFDFLTTTFPGIIVSHEIYPLIHNTGLLNTPVLNFHIHSSWFYALTFGAKGMEFLNTFEYRNETDMVYYMLSVMEQLNQSTLPVVISGKIDRDDVLFSVIRKYIPRAEIAAYDVENHPLKEGFPCHYLPGIIVL
jgi:hypothetical protein